MERSLRSRLRSHRLSESFIDRCAEDALQRGVVEYLRAREAGTEIRDPGGFVVGAAFRRAIDELRREARRADGVEVEWLLEEGTRSEPSTEEIVIEESAAAELRDAIGTLPAEERQALSLHYFEEEPAASAARLLYCSESTFRRRLRKALADLAELLGTPAPEPGSHRGLEIGLAAWAGLGGGRVVVSSSPLDHLVGALDSLHSLPGRIVDRLRGTGTELAATYAPERIGVVASGPAGKVIGGCAGAAVVCVLSGVVGPGVQLGGSHTEKPRHQPTPKSVAHHKPASKSPLIVEPKVHHEERVEPPQETATASPGPTAPAPRHTHHAEHRSAEKAHHQEATTATEEPASEEVRVEEQFSGVAQAAAESESEAGSPPSTGEGASVEKATTTQNSTVDAPTGSSHASSEERQVEEQIRGPLAR